MCYWLGSCDVEFVSGEGGLGRHQQTPPKPRCLWPVKSVQLWGVYVWAKFKKKEKKRLERKHIIYLCCYFLSISPAIIFLVKVFISFFKIFSFFFCQFLFDVLFCTLCFFLIFLRVLFCFSVTFSSPFCIFFMLIVTSS